MLRDDDVVLIISNAPDLLLAKRIAHVLVEDGLAACVNLGAPGLSIYMWQGEVEGPRKCPSTSRPPTRAMRRSLPRWRRCIPTTCPKSSCCP